MKQNNNIITLQIRYETDASSLSFIKTLQKQFNSCLRFTYNRLCDNKSLTTKELTALQKNLNNITLIKSHLKNSAIHKAKEIIAIGAEKSVIGNIVYRNEKLPDPVLASIELSRRGFEYGTQYIYKRRQIKKTVILPDFNSVKTRIRLSLEEMGICGHVKSWTELFSAVKKSGVKYRFPLAECLSASHFSKFYKQKMLIMYSF